MHTHIHIHIHIQIQLQLQIQIHIHTHYIYIYICVCVCVCLYTQDKLIPLGSLLFGMEGVGFLSFPRPGFWEEEKHYNLKRMRNLTLFCAGRAHYGGGCAPFLPSVGLRKNVTFLMGSTMQHFFVLAGLIMDGDSAPLVAMLGHLGERKLLHFGQNSKCDIVLYRQASSWSYLGLAA